MVYCVALAAFSRRLDFWLYRHRYPGQWLGEAGMFRNADVILFVCLVLAAGIGLSFYLKRRFYALMMMAIVLAYSSVSPHLFNIEPGWNGPITNARSGRRRNSATSLRRESMTGASSFGAGLPMGLITARVSSMIRRDSLKRMFQARFGMAAVKI